MDRHIFIYNGGYVTVLGDYTCDPKINANLGSSWDDYVDGKYLKLNDEQATFYESNPSLTPEEIYTMQEGDIVSSSDIEDMVIRINDFDTSKEVNVFYINETPVWFDKQMRVALNNSLSIESAVGKETTVLWVNNIPYTLDISTVKSMLEALELYAIQCFNVTQNKISEVRKIQSRETLRNFNIEEGYPEKLTFNI